MEGDGRRRKVDVGVVLTLYCHQREMASKNKLLTKKK